MTARGWATARLSCRQRAAEKAPEAGEIMMDKDIKAARKGGGYDLTICAPMAFSLAYASASTGARENIKAAHEAAVAEALARFGKPQRVTHFQDRAGGTRLHTHVLLPSEKATMGAVVRILGRLAQAYADSLTPAARGLGIDIADDRPSVTCARSPRGKEARI